MSNLKELKNRIKSVNDTKKITNAMYLISSTKMNRAKREFDNTKPYFDAIKNEISNVFSLTDVGCDYFYETDEDTKKGTAAFLVITSDRGLCGSYNYNVLKEARKYIDKEPNRKVYTIGEFGRNYFNSRRIEQVDDFRFLSINPTLNRAREIAERFLGEFYEKKIERLYVAYTDFKNGFVGGVPKVVEVLPFRKEDFINELDVDPYMKFLPTPEKVLEHIVESYLVGYIYSLLVSSFCSEQAARMNAMEKANDNASDILSDLKGEYNKCRQSEITNEIIEVSAGAKAKKKKGAKNWKEE